MALGCTLVLLCLACACSAAPARLFLSRDEYASGAIKRASTGERGLPPALPLRPTAAAARRLADRRTRTLAPISAGRRQLLTREGRHNRDEDHDDRGKHAVAAVAALG